MRESECESRCGCCQPVAVLVHYVRHRLLAVLGENVDLLGEVKRYRSTAFSVREPQRVLVIAARWHNCNSTSVMPLPVQFMQSQQQTFMC